jgi:tetratricopeptide (TPR) repeat protein
MSDRDVQHRVCLAALSIALVAAIAAVYWDVREHHFLPFDDDVAIAHNQGLERGLSAAGVAWAFQTTLVGNWIPVTVVSLLADQTLHGRDPGLVIAGNVALHALATVLLLWAFAALTQAPWLSAAVAAVFALHPLHVESVAWAAMRKDSLSGVFFAGSLLAYARFAERRSTGRGIAVAVLAAAGLLAKPTLVTLPCVLLLLDFWPLGRVRRADGSLDVSSLRAAAIEKLPIFALAAAASVAALITQHAEMATVSFDAFPLGARIGMAAVTYARYIASAIWPVDLAVFYPIPSAGVDLREVATSALLLLGISLVVLRERRRRPWLLTGWLAFLCVLVPTVGLVQVGSQARADRYMYLPLIGLSILPIWTLGEIASRWPRARLAAVALAVVAIGALGVQSRRQLRVWQNGITLFEHALRVTNDNHVSRTELSDALLEDGRVDEAAVQLRRAVELRGDFAALANNLAWLLLTHPNVEPADPEEALRLASRAVALTHGRSPQPLYTLALAQAREGRFDEAVETARRAETVARARGAMGLAREIAARAARFARGRSD